MSATKSLARPDRATLRAELPKHLERLRNTLSLAVAALDGPDPEAALGFLAVLDEHLHAVPGVREAIKGVGGARAA